MNCPKFNKPNWWVLKLFLLPLGLFGFIFPMGLIWLLTLGSVDFSECANKGMDWFLKDTPLEF